MFYSKIFFFSFDTVWQDGLWLKLWDMGVKGRILNEEAEYKRGVSGENKRMWHIQTHIARTVGIYWQPFWWPNRNKYSPKAKTAETCDVIWWSKVKN